MGTVSNHTRTPEPVPADPSGFVGRRRELAEVRRLLGRSRMVTLTGMGGVGKTRLARRIAEDVRRAFPDGVWTVELAELTNPDAIAQAVIESLEIRDQSSRPAVEVLTAHLRDRRILLVLDNCEHLLPECADLAGEMLAVAPGLRILATSRHVLGAMGERTYAVPPLSMPGPDTCRSAAAMLGASDAVRLFAERARQARPGFAVSEDNAEAVQRICRRLDGLPLAIELAAAQLRTLTAGQLLDRLDDRFRASMAGSPRAPSRHRTLRALIDWSHDLCGERQRLLWARASVFSGGFRLDSAEAVCAGDGLPEEEMLDVVADLIDRSILIRDPDTGTSRYRMLETIRRYGQDRLRESGEEKRLRRRHRDYHRRMAAEARAALSSPSEIGWYRRLEADHANLRAALEYGFARPGEAETGLAMATDLLWHWTTNSHFHEGRRLLGRGLALVTRPCAARANGLWAYGLLALAQGDTPSVEAALQESRELAERLGLESALGYAVSYSAALASDQGRVEEAIALYETAERHHRATGDVYGLLLVLVRRTMALASVRKVADAIAAGESCVALCESRGDGWVCAYAKMALAIAVWLDGDTGRAATLAQGGLRTSHMLGSALPVGLAVEVLAWIAATEGRYVRAARLFGALGNIWKDIGGRSIMPIFGHLIQYHDECTARTMDVLGEQRFRDEVEHGARLGYDETLAYALEERAPDERRGGRPAGPSGLTPREMEVARLVTEGMSNKTIASALAIAQRTAEGHVEHILLKLGLRSRAQIAGWFVRHRQDGGEPLPEHEDSSGAT